MKIRLIYASLQYETFVTSLSQIYIPTKIDKAMRNKDEEMKASTKNCWVLMSINFQNFDQNIECNEKH